MISYTTNNRYKHWDLNPIQHLWKTLGQQLWARYSHPTPVLELTDAPVYKWEQIPAVIIIYSCISQVCFVSLAMWESQRR